MDKEVNVELYDETIAKLDKLAAQLGMSRDDLINQSLKELLHETE